MGESLEPRELTKKTPVGANKKEWESQNFEIVCQLEAVIVP